MADALMSGMSGLPFCNVNALSANLAGALANGGVGSDLWAQVAAYNQMVPDASGQSVFSTATTSPSSPATVCRQLLSSWRQRSSSLPRRLGTPEGRVGEALRLAREAEYALRFRQPDGTIIGNYDPAWSLIKAAVYVMSGAQGKGLTEDPVFF